MNMALNGIPNSKEPFVKGFCTREKLPNWQTLGMIVSGKRLVIGINR
jgi:hypothetical protein